MKAERVQSQLKKTPGWKTVRKKSALSGTHTLPSFRAALAFVAFVGGVAESPEIGIRYCEVTLVLTTHVEGGSPRRTLGWLGRWMGGSSAFAEGNR